MGISKSTRVLSAVLYFLPCEGIFPTSLFHAGLYSTVLGLLLRETKHCGGRELRWILIGAAAIFVTKFVLRMYIYIKNNSEDIDGDIGGYYECYKAILPGKPELLEKGSYLYTLIIKEFDSKKITPLMWIIYAVMMVYVIYEGGVRIKIAIPNHSSSSCGWKSKDGMIVLKALVIILAISTVVNIFMVFLAETQEQRNMGMYVNLFCYACGFGFSLFTFTKLFSTWRGKGVRIYEFVVLAALMPLFRMY